MLVSGVGSGGPKSAALRFSVTGCGGLRKKKNDLSKRRFVGHVKMMFNKCKKCIYIYVLHN